ncbi:YVTN repeat-like/Quino protein amine dehydrogenase [Thelephora ganbajun]|uniref:YVTN repeat-like/Quino protein amine dehydrogenase n=1 Tax=Thelephora ganbajun TaxID=370292 RepID=A0ACB6ZIM2_THEGA|nr:YVTN repeat-like/Quino protein amine dehydrogenase [Thelephora ganbajun]
MLVRSSTFPLEPDSPMRHIADMSVLNSCRRAHGAGYQHGDRKGCLRGTRETVLNDIESWTRDFENPPVFWLNGLAGTGKSTIAQTVSERVFGDGLLGASFFCSRDFEDRSDLHFIFPTLAFQLAHKYPTFRSVLVPLLRSNPDIVHESLMNQMGELIVKPLKSADVWTVVIIDALDECKDEEPQSAILSVLGRFVKQMPKVKFFITGRPEPRIKDGFRLPLLVDSTNVFVLHDIHPSLINNDIWLFLKHELSEVARRRRLERWPRDEHIDVLCDRAGGLFVYAVATVKFLDSSTRLPERQLDAIVNFPDHTVHEGKTRFNPKTTLDALYASILKAAFSEEDPEVDSKVRSTIGVVVLVVNPLPLSAIAELIGLDPREVTQFLTLLQSLLAVDEDSSQPVKPFHKSFPDFITDSSRCTDPRFWISPESLHLELATNCLRVMNDELERNLLSLPDYALNSEVEDLGTRIDDRTSDALRYACQSWHTHLTKAKGDVADVIPHLRVFLEEKFLAWLEVVSVLGAVRGAVVGLEQLIPWLQEVSRNEELLETTRDYFHFVVAFFEPINVSATHIYHSALELSPLSSITRRRYHCQQHPFLPRVIVGTRKSWEGGIIVPSKNRHLSCTWSPCGQFIAAQNREAAEIRDSLSLELLSTLPIYGRDCTALAYSPDGRFIASLYGTSLVIWDIQTGGVAKEIDHGRTWNNSLLWSLDGGTIGIMGRKPWDTYVVRTYDVASGTAHSPSKLESTDEPHLWAYGTSFRVMTAERAGQACTINIFEVGSIPKKIESFHIESWAESHTIGSFSQTTHRISYSHSSHLIVLDIRDSRYLLEEGYFTPKSHCFSPDGSLFAASQGSNVHIWKYTSDRYAGWREFSAQDLTYHLDFLRFSPTSSSLLGCLGGIPRVWRLDGPSIGAHHGSDQQVVTLSSCGGYIVAGHKGDNVIIITNLLSQAPPCVIDTGIVTETLALTGNILLVRGSKTITAWRLAEEGVVGGIFSGGRARLGNSIWTIPVPPDLPRPYESPRLYVQDQTVAIEQERNVIHAYHTETGEALEVVQLNPDCRYHGWGGISLNGVDHLRKYG